MNAQPPVGGLWSPEFDRFVPDFLAKPRNPLHAIAGGWAVAFPISMLLSVLAQTLAPDALAPTFSVSGYSAVFALAVFAPAVETLIMGAVLLLLLKFVRPEVAVAVSVVGWAIMHSTIAPIWGLVIWWPFLIFSILFVTWRQHSLAMAFMVPMAVHGLQNLLPALLIANGVAT